MNASDPSNEAGSRQKQRIRLGVLPWIALGCGVLAGCEPGVGSGIAEQASADRVTSSAEAAEKPGDRRRKQPPRVLIVKRSDFPTGRLSGELIRQMLLVIAREEFGVPTCDVALGETIAPDEPGQWFMSVNIFRTQKAPTVNVMRNGSQGSGSWGPSLNVELVDGNFPWAVFEVREDKEQVPPDLEQFVAAAVDLSDEFSRYLSEVQGLKPLGRIDNESNNVEVVDVELRQREMGVVPQFEAVRMAHALPASSTKDRLLAVGYANLGLLTQHLWGPKSKIFAARSLIYAERAARAEPGSKSAEAKAYAAAMAGLHATALKHAESAGESPSPRLQAVVAYCRFREDELLKLAEASPELRELAVVLACLAVEPTELDHLVAETYAKAMEVSPDCFRIYDAVASQGLISLHHDVTLRAPAQLTQAVPTRLRAVRGLPKSVRDLVTAEAVLPAELAKTLQAEIGLGTAPQEPSWPVLGQLISDEALVQAHRRLNFLRSPLGVPVGEEYDTFRNFVGDHQFAVALDLLSDNPDLPTIREELTSWPVTQKDEKGDYQTVTSDFGPQHEMLLATIVLQASLDKKTRNALLSHRSSADWIAGDLVTLMDMRGIGMSSGGFTASDAANVLDSISPHHPFRAMTQMRQSEPTPEQVAAWEREYADRPALLVPLAESLLANGRFVDATRVAARATEIDPSFEAFDVLSKAYLAVGHDKESAAAAEQAFEQPSFGLDDTRSRVALARRYMSRGEFEKAEPHAEAAAESYAAWAIYCVIDCYEGLGEWKQAEEWLIRLAERYPQSSAATWYLWSRRTGQGDEATARRLADVWADQLDRPDDQTTPAHLQTLGLYQFAAGRTRAATETFETLTRKMDNAGSGLITAAGYLRLGEREKAVEILEFAAGKAGDAAMRAGIFLKSLKTEEPLDAETVAEFDRAIDTFAADEPLRFRTFFGEILIHLGNKEDGLRFLRQVAEAGPRNGVWVEQNLLDRAIASEWLRAHLTGQQPEEEGKKEPNAAESSPDV